MRVEVRLNKVIIDSVFMKFSSATTMTVDIREDIEDKSKFYAAHVTDSRLYSLYSFTASKSEIKSMLDFRERGGKFALLYTKDDNKYIISTEDIIQDELDSE